jgi:type II secretory pathway pseudopilin PulG
VRASGPRFYSPRAAYKARAGGPHYTGAHGEGRNYVCRARDLSGCNPSDLIKEAGMQRYVMAAVVIVGLTFILVVAVPNVLEARNRSKQNRTMADIRTISTAWEARATDTKSYHIKATCGITETAESFGKLCTVPADQLAQALEPTYLKHVPRTDGWGNPLDFRIGGPDAKGHAQTYAVRSRGKDQRVDGESYISGEIRTYEQDIIYTNGAFLTFPEGI